MIKRFFRALNREVSEVGLGCWQLGGSDWGNLDESDAFAVLQTAVDCGVNFFDTADVYGGGRSEELIGRFLASRKNDLTVATKLGRMPPGGNGEMTRESVRAHTEASLRRLGVDCIDLTQLHCIPTKALASGEVFDWMRELRVEGKIRSFGASVESDEEALIAIAHEGIASLQIIFNIFRQKPIETLFDTAQKRGISIIVRLPLASGLLSGKYRSDTTFSPSDHRTYNRNGDAFNVGETFAGIPFETGIELVKTLQSIVPSGTSLAPFALRWILDYPAVTVIIPGARNPDQVRNNASATSVHPIDSTMHQAISDFYRDKVQSVIRGPY